MRVDDEEGVIDIRRGSTQPPPTATSLIPFDLIRSQPKPESLQTLARWVIEHGIEGAGPYGAARDLLARQPPRLGQGEGQLLRREGEDAQNAARRLVAGTHESYLAIQGPPGSGKSTVGGEMIVDLVAAGKRIGVTANSHKVIGELLAKVGRVAGERGVTVAIGQRAPDEPTYPDAEHLATNDAARDALAAGSLDVVGGTTWLWAREDMIESVDVLFIDEAGQMSLADAIAASLSAMNLVLLGDPQQLDQPLQGVPPAGSGALGAGACASRRTGYAEPPRTFPRRKLAATSGDQRVHVRGVLRRAPALAPRSRASRPRGRATALRNRHPVPASVSQRSVERFAGGSRRVSRLGPRPYARQTHLHRPNGVSALPRHTRCARHQPLTTRRSGPIRVVLPDFRVGTVDKFQGQEAPISIYSMATSSGAEAPRGMEFLYSLNRLNVATSRAQCLAVVVASPRAHTRPLPHAPADAPRERPRTARGSSH